MPRTLVGTAATLTHFNNETENSNLDPMSTENTRFLYRLELNPVSTQFAWSYIGLLAKLQCPAGRHGRTGARSSYDRTRVINSTAAISDRPTRPIENARLENTAPDRVKDTGLSNVNERNEFSRLTTMQILLPPRIYMNLYSSVNDSKTQKHKTAHQWHQGGNPRRLSVCLPEVYCWVFTVRLRSIRTVFRSTSAMSVCLSVRPSNACIVTKRKHLAKKFNYD